jgi:phospholipid/cholesterol/gamma-HCH transport system substrate-binding protein
MTAARTVVIRRRLQGVAFLLVVVTLIALALAKYNGVFTSGVPVSLQVDSTGLQLDDRADVKVRGLIVGQVDKVTSSGELATVHMELQPDMVHLIPDNVSARLLPKTLFGEKYVSLVLPAQPSGRTLASGDVITQDRSQTARELEAALDDLLPLLQAVKPQDLAATLGAVSTALDGRGKQLGNTLVRQEQLVSGLNSVLPQLQEDISRTGDLADTYNKAAPDLLAALADLTTTSRTVVDQQQNLAHLYASVTGSAEDLRGFLAANEDNLISLAADSKPTLQTLARYSPEYPCLLNQLTALVPRIDRTMGVGTNKPGLHIKLEVTNSRGKYLPGVDEPRYEDDRGPTCYRLPDGQRFPQYPGGPLRDGATAPPAAAIGPSGQGPAQTAGQSAGAAMGLPNSPAEQQYIASLLAAASGKKPSEIPRWSSFLVGPLLRGTEVTVR